MLVHLTFDILAALAAAGATALVWRWRLKGTPNDPSAVISKHYMFALVAGAVAGAYLFGTVALRLDGVPGVGRSIVGALAGAITAIEGYKWKTGIRSSTGLIFVPGFAVSTAVGRVGCLLSGLSDRTHGIPTGKSWGWDFGDGIPRYPVQLFESVAMLLFLAVTLWALAHRSTLFMSQGFYLLVGFYATQRFLWEFLKPGATLIGRLNIFHLLCLTLIMYSLIMMASAKRQDA